MKKPFNTKRVVLSRKNQNLTKQKIKKENKKQNEDYLHIKIE